MRDESLLPVLPPVPGPAPGPGTIPIVVCVLTLGALGIVALMTGTDGAILTGIVGSLTGYLVGRRRAC